MSPCLTCGHDYVRHVGQGPGPFDDGKQWCRIPGCTCTRHEAVAGPPPDLQQAIHAAENAIAASGYNSGWLPARNELARITVEAAWPHMAGQLQAAQAENQQLRNQVAEYEHSINWGTSCLSCAKLLDANIADHERAEKAEAEGQRLRERVIELEHHAALGQVDQP